MTHACQLSKTDNSISEKSSKKSEHINVRARRGRILSRVFWGDRKLLYAFFGSAIVKIKLSSQHKPYLCGYWRDDTLKITLLELCFRNSQKTCIFSP